MKVTWEDAALALLTALIVWLLGYLAAWQVVGTSMFGGDFFRTTTGEWVKALGLAAAALATPALVIWFAWRDELWLTVAVQAVLFLILLALALWWTLEMLRGY